MSTMHALSHLKETDLASELQRLDRTTIKSIFGRTIYNRGLDYYMDDLVTIEAVIADKVVATVTGSMAYDYKILLKHDGDVLYGSCSCPYYDACKHLAAVLLVLKEDYDWKAQQNNLDDDIEDIDFEEEEDTPVNNTYIHLPNFKQFPSATVENEDPFEQFLLACDKEKLMNLVRQFAPEKYKTDIRLSQSSPKQKTALLQDYFQKIDALLDSEPTFIDQFDEEFFQYLKEMKQLWNNGEELTIAAYLLNLPRRIEAVIEDDGLNRLSEYDDEEDEYEYDEYYGYDNEEAYAEYNHIPLIHYLFEFSMILAVQERQSFYAQLWEKLQGLTSSGHSLVWGDLYRFYSPENIGELRETLVKQAFFRELRLSTHIKIYELLKPTLSEQEQLEFLEEYQENHYFFGLLIDYWEKQGQTLRVIKMLNIHLLSVEPNPNKAVFFHVDENLVKLYHKRLQLAYQHEGDAEQQLWAKSYFEFRSNEDTAYQIYQLNGSLPTNIAQNLEEKSIMSYINFLERIDDTDSIRQLFKKYPENAFRYDTQIDFYKKYIERYPEKGIEQLNSALASSLVPTDKNAYYEVVDLLLAIKKVEEPTLFKKRVSNIKEKYKRRTSLMKIMRNNNL